MTRSRSARPRWDSWQNIKTRFSPSHPGDAAVLTRGAAHTQRRAHRVHGAASNVATFPSRGPIFFRGQRFHSAWGARGMRLLPIHGRSHPHRHALPRAPARCSVAHRVSPRLRRPMSLPCNCLPTALVHGFLARLLPIQTVNCRLPTRTGTSLRKLLLITNATQNASHGLTDPSGKLPATIVTVARPFHPRQSL